MGIFHLIILYKGLTLDGGTREKRVPFLLFLHFYRNKPTNYLFYRKQCVSLQLNY